MSEPKFTNISMEWNESGALVNSTMPIDCPRCGEQVKAGIEHRCGDRVIPEEPKAKKKARIRA
jgi:hypothetical protein